MGCPADNVTQAWPFDNLNASGTFLPLHRPTYSKEVDKSGEYPYAWHFNNRKRTWEMRIQFRFKREVKTSEMVFGIELDEFVPLDAVTDRMMKFTIGVLRHAVGNQLYHSQGDDPMKVQGEPERP